LKFCVTEDITNSLAYSDLILHKTEEKMNTTEYKKHVMHMTTIRPPNETYIDSLKYLDSRED